MTTLEKIQKLMYNNQYEEATELLLKETNVKVVIKEPTNRQIENFMNYWGDDYDFSWSVWRVGIVNKLTKKSYWFNYGQGRGLIGKPSNYSVIAILQKVECFDFEDFCLQYGYEYAHKNKKFYNAVVKEYEGVVNVFGEENLELLQEIY